MPIARRPENDSAPTTMVPTSHSDHDLYKTGDHDAPDSIKDSNGDVALGMCRKCGKAERDLDESCIPQSNYIDDSDPQKALAEVMDGTPITLRQGESWTPPSKLAVSITNVSRQHDNNYPLWQGPCEEGPLGGITQSMIVRFLSCRERFRLKYVFGLEPHDKWNKNIGYGNMWHVCEEAHAANKSWQGSLINYYNDQMNCYPLQREELTKWFNVCCVQFPEYIQYWTNHPDVKNRTPLMQEQVFDVRYTLPSGRVVQLRGKFDSVDLIDNGIYLQENKTKGDVDKLQIERHLKFDLQTMLYLVALEEYASDPGEPLHELRKVKGYDTPILGVRYNVVRRPLSGGVGNIKPHAAKYTKTKTVPAETAEEFYERLRRDYLADDPDHWFFRVRAEISARDIQVFRETCLDPLLETVCWWYDLTTRSIERPVSFVDYHPGYMLESLHYRTPFGVWSALEEGGATEYDHYLETGSDAGLRRVETLFPELQ